MDVSIFLHNVQSSYEALLDIIVVQIAFLIKRSYMSVPIVFIIEPKKVNKFWST